MKNFKWVVALVIIFSLGTAIPTDSSTRSPISGKWETTAGSTRRFVIIKHHYLDTGIPGHPDRFYRIQHFNFGSRTGWLHISTTSHRRFNFQVHGRNLKFHHRRLVPVDLIR